MRNPAPGASLLHQIQEETGRSCSPKYHLCAESLTDLWKSKLSRTVDQWLQDVFGDDHHNAAQDNPHHLHLSQHQPQLWNNSLGGLLG